MACFSMRRLNRKSCFLIKREREEDKLYHKIPAERGIMPCNFKEYGLMPQLGHR